jgi:KilA-N domain
MLSKFVLKDYGGESIRIDRTRGLFSLTDICKATGKNVADFLRLQGTTDYIHALSRAMGIPIENLLIVGKGSKGTWGHPQLSIKCAAWVSAEFEILITSWVWELLTTGKVELATASTPAVTVAIDDPERMANSGQSNASRGFPAVKVKRSEIPSDWATVSQVLIDLLGDGIDIARSSGASQSCSTSMAAAYRSTNGHEPTKTKGIYHYPPSCFGLIRDYYFSFAEIHREVMTQAAATALLEAQNAPKQCSLFDLFPDIEAA